MGIYKDMKFLKDGEIGNFKLSHYEVKENDFYARVRAGIPVGEYIKLTNDGECVMSDTPMEKRTNMNFVANAHGKVLIGGLGIGLILLAIQDNEEVEKITVVEKNKEVIELVGNQLPLNNKVEIVNADIFDYVPTEKYNTIYFDIWNYTNSDVFYGEMQPLMAQYEEYLDFDSDNPFIDCWCSYEAEHNIRFA